MKPSAKLFLATLVGGLVVHGALAACGGGPSSADAQSTPTSCATWQVMAESLPVDGYGAITAGATLVVDAGWEPFSTTGDFVVLRQCAPSTP